jgi:hypothetical protein
VVVSAADLVRYLAVIRPVVEAVPTEPFLLHTKELESVDLLILVE